MSDETIKKAFEIAISDLRSNYNHKGIVAGKTHFSDYWLRDMCFASFGAVEIKDYEIVRRGFDFFISKQRKNGLIAFRTGINTVLKYFVSHLFWMRSPVELPRWVDEKISAHVVDTLPSIIIAIANYVRKTNDKEYAKKHLAKLEISINKYYSKDMASDGLIEEKGYSHWADSIRKSGKTLYSNVLYCHSLKELAYLCRTCNHSKKAKHYDERFIKMRETINKMFWLNDHYVDWIHGDKIYDYFSVDGNMLAVLYNIADEKKSKLICAYLLSHKNLYRPVPCKTNYPEYPAQFEYIGLSFFLKYHNMHAAWLWLGCISALALDKAGRKKEAVDFMNSMAKKIVEYSQVYEIYNEKGEPYNNIIYRSEQNFAWSSGVFIYACKELKLIK